MDFLLLLSSCTPFKLNNSNSFEQLNIQNDAAGNVHKKYQQYYNGIPVWGAQISSHQSNTDGSQRFTGQLTKELEQDIKAGMYFDSSIPQGYGVGSSGALVAALYDKYAQDKITVLENLTREKLLKLKAIFSEMESFFHGKSSGLDPLNSYLSIPILINSKDNIEATGIPSQNTNGKGAVFLLDSGIIGETAPMVGVFMEKMKQEGFRTMLKDQFIKHTDACVNDFLKGDVNSLFRNTKELSKVVLNHFKPMIPKQFHSIWKAGIESNTYYLKLCGSGGGGYILGFTEDFQAAQKALIDHKLEVVYNF